VVDGLFRYVELLRRWNSRINLTSLPLDPLADETIDRLLIEPLCVAAQLEEIDGRWFDLGSGGGSPAIPIKVALPRLRLVMVESRERKAAFLREAVRELRLKNSSVLNMRFEALQADPSLASTADLVTVRAVKVDPDLIALCEFLLHSGGLLVMLGYKGEPVPGFEVTPKAGFFRRVCST